MRRFMAIISLVHLGLILQAQDTIRESGVASYYHDKFRGRKTASGERYDPRELTAAHRTAPFGTKITVVNLSNGKSIRVRVNDRGPFSHGRVIDISRSAADALGITQAGMGKVELIYRKKKEIETEEVPVKVKALPAALFEIQQADSSGRKGYYVFLGSSESDCWLEAVEQLSGKGPGKLFVRDNRKGGLGSIEILSGKYLTAAEAEMALNAWKQIQPEARLLKEYAEE